MRARAKQGTELHSLESQPFILDEMDLEDWEAAQRVGRLPSQQYKETMEKERAEAQNAY